MRLSHWRVLLLFAPLVALSRVFPSAAQPVPSFPEVSLDVGVRQRVDGKLDDGIHLVELSCYRSGCSLKVISLNQCSVVGDLPNSFTASVAAYSTRDDELKIEVSEGRIIARYGASDVGGDAEVTLRFEYSPYGVLQRLTSFSGGYVKHSALLGRVVPAEYIPFNGEFTARTLSCPLLVPGVSIERQSE